MSPLLLDTNAAIWLSRDELKASASEKLDEAARMGVATYLSPITAWEVGLLVSRNRLSLGTTPQRWFARILAMPNVHLAELSPDILIARLSCRASRRAIPPTASCWRPRAISAQRWSRGIALC